MESRVVDINFMQTEEKAEYIELINHILKKAFEEENLNLLNIYVNVILTTPDRIKEINKTYRNMDQETDVLSFPMFEKEELEEIIKKGKLFPTQEVLGDIIISVPRVEEQAKEYGHSFERELSYMIIHGFYHLMGYDHIKEIDKKEMRKKEEKILSLLNITR